MIVQRAQCRQGVYEALLSRHCLSEGHETKLQKYCRVLVSAKDQHSWLRPEAARRKLIQLLSVSAAAACFPRPPLAHAGLLQLPATELNNEYYLVCDLYWLVILYL